MVLSGKATPTDFNRLAHANSPDHELDQLALVGGDHVDRTALQLFLKTRLMKRERGFTKIQNAMAFRQRYGRQHAGLEYCREARFVGRRD